jgi:hypothetical protein
MPEHGAVTTHLLHQGRIDTRSTAMVRHRCCEHRLTSAATSTLLRRVPLSPARHQRVEEQTPGTNLATGQHHTLPVVAISFLTKTMALSRTSTSEPTPWSFITHRCRLRGPNLALIPIDGTTHGPITHAHERERELKHTAMAHQHRDTRFSGDERRDHANGLYLTQQEMGALRCWRRRLSCWRRLSQQG